MMCRDMKPIMNSARSQYAYLWMPARMCEKNKWTQNPAHIIKMIITQYYLNTLKTEKNRQRDILLQTYLQAVCELVYKPEARVE